MPVHQVWTVGRLGVFQRMGLMGLAALLLAVATSASAGAGEAQRIPVRVADGSDLTELSLEARSGLVELNGAWD